MHPTIRMTLDGTPVRIDEEIAPLIKWFWDQGVKTQYCCQGDSGGLDSRAYVCFECEDNEFYQDLICKLSPCYELKLSKIDKIGPRLYRKREIDLKKSVPLSLFKWAPDNIKEFYSDDLFDEHYMYRITARWFDKGHLLDFMDSLGLLNDNANIERVFPSGTVDLF